MPTIGSPRLRSATSTGWVACASASRSTDEERAAEIARTTPLLAGGSHATVLTCRTVPYLGHRCQPPTRSRRSALSGDPRAAFEPRWPSEFLNAAGDD